jgi:hypothetical protein
MQNISWVIWVIRPLKKYGMGRVIKTLELKLKEVEKTLTFAVIAAKALRFGYNMCNAF